MLLEGVPQRAVALDDVVVPAPAALPDQHAGLLELPEDALDRALGDTHRRRDVAHARVGVPRDAHERVRVVTEKSPAVPLTHAAFLPLPPGARDQESRPGWASGADFRDQVAQHRVLTGFDGAHVHVDAVVGHANAAQVGLISNLCDTFYFSFFG